MKLLISNLKYLDCNGYTHWSKKSYWSSEEAIYLSMNFEPKQDGNIATTDEDAEKMGLEFLSRQDDVTRARKIDPSMRKLISEEDGTGTQEIVYLPKIFSDWAIKSLPSFPPELFDAVTNFAHKTTNNSPQLTGLSLSQSVEVTDESRILLLNSLKLNGIDTESFTPVISVDDLKCLYKLIAPKKTPDPDHLAEKNKGIRKRKVDATNYMFQQITSDCKCNHSKLADVTFRHNDDWNNMPGKKLSLAQLKKLSMLIVPPERRLVSNQHTTKPAYKPSECNCQQPNHS